MAADDGTAPAGVPDEADLLAGLVLACPAVAGLSSGPFGTVATYLPGRTVAGVRANPEGVEIHVVGRFGPTCATIDDQIRVAVAPMLGGRPLTVGIDDLDV